MIQPCMAIKLWVIVAHTNKYDEWVFYACKRVMGSRVETVTNTQNSARKEI